MTFLVRTEGNPRDMAASVRGEIQAFDAELPIFGIKSMEGVYEPTLCRTGGDCFPGRCVLPLVALLLASVGDLRCHELRRRPENA